jgi:tRNA G18 (ribose-2'-O)-methylase SpoU
VRSISAAAFLAEADAVGRPILVADGAGTDVERWRGRDRFALVVGNEGAGVRPGVRAAADAVVAIPMRGAAESLNVGVAGSILMHTLTRGRNE